MEQRAVSALLSLNVIGKTSAWSLRKTIWSSLGRRCKKLPVRAYNLTNFFLPATHKPVPWGGRRTISYNRQGGKQSDWGRMLHKCVIVQYLPALSVCGYILSASLLAVKSVHDPSCVSSHMFYRSLPPLRDSSQIAVLVHRGLL